jgi:hypothetical protein
MNDIIFTGFIEDARNEKCSDAEVAKLSEIFAGLLPSFVADATKSENNNKWYSEVIGDFSLNTKKTKSDKEFDYFTGSFESDEKNLKIFVKIPK